MEIPPLICEIEYVCIAIQYDTMFVTLHKSNVRMNAKHAWKAKAFLVKYFKYA